MNEDIVSELFDDDHEHLSFELDPHKVAGILVCVMACVGIGVLIMLAVQHKKESEAYSLEVKRYYEKLAKVHAQPAVTASTDAETKDV